MKLTDHDFQLTFFHLCSGVTLHWRLTSTICNNRAALLFFLMFLIRLASRSLCLWLAKNHQRNAHKWWVCRYARIIHQNALSTILSRFKNPWGCARSINIFTSREVACFGKTPLWRGSWVTALLTGHRKQSGQTQQCPRLPMQQKQQNPPQLRLLGWGCQTRGDEGHHCFKTLRFINLEADDISLDQPPLTHLLDMTLFNETLDLEQMWIKLDTDKSRYAGN